MSASHCYDVVIVGAGAAGLSCAASLLKQKTDLLVLEARPRIGGRVYSQKSPHHAIPIELGAEFIHAASPLLFHLLNITGHDFYDVQFEQLYLKNRKLVEQKDFWDRLEKVLALAKEDRKADRSMAEFMKAHRRVLTPDMRALLIGYIEGFQGADINLIGEKAFSKSEKNKRDLNGNNDFRPIGAYSEILQGLLKNSSLEKRILLKHAVTDILWDKKAAQVTTRLPSGKRRHFYAKHVVLALPLGVLQGLHPKSRVRIQPEIPEIAKSLAHLHIGHVQRMLFIFQSRFWENLSEDKPICFLRAGPEYYFPTWWTLSPLRAPYLIAWQGGPKAKEMSLWSQDQRIDTALKTLSLLTKRSVRFLRKELISVHHHNWSKDPFTMGGYTYTGIQPTQSKETSHREFKKFLWLTGEALSEGDGQGTVHGALEHGEETAQKILKRL